MSDLKSFWRFLRSTPKAANLLALATITLWVVKALWLDFLPEPLPGAFELGKIVEGIFSAVIAGWVFYLLFALLPDATQKAHLAPFILRSTAMIAGDASAIVTEVEVVSGCKLSFNDATEGEIRTAFASVPFASHPRMVLDLRGTPATWFDYLRNQRTRTFKQIAGLTEQSRYIEPELLAIILKISRCTFLSMTEQMESAGATLPHLGPLASTFYKYVVDCRELARWHDSHLTPPETAILPDLG